MRSMKKTGEPGRGERLGFRGLAETIRDRTILMK